MWPLKQIELCNAGGSEVNPPALLIVFIIVFPHYYFKHVFDFNNNKKTSTYCCLCLHHKCPCLALYCESLK